MFTDFITSPSELFTQDQLHLAITSTVLSRNERPDVRLSCSYLYRTTHTGGAVKGILKKNFWYGRVFLLADRDAALILIRIETGLRAFYQYSSPPASTAISIPVARLSPNRKRKCYLYRKPPGRPPSFRSVGQETFEKLSGHALNKASKVVSRVSRQGLYVPEAAVWHDSGKGTNRRGRGE